MPRGDRPQRRRYQRGPHLVARTLPSGRWWYAWVPPAIRPVALHTQDRAEAERRFRELLARAGHEPVGPHPGEPAAGQTLGSIAEAWLASPQGYTSRTHQTHSERIEAVGRALEELGATYPADITPEVLDRWMTARQAVVSRATINRDLRSLKVCLEWAAERGHCAVCVPVRDRPALREPTREDHRIVPSPDEVARILDATPAHQRPALSVLYGTGIRVEELLRLAVGCLHDGRLWIEPERGPADTAEPGKSYRSRAIPAAPAVEAQVTAYLAGKAAGRGRSGRTGLSKHALTAAMHAAAARAGVPRTAGLHDLRRGFATECVRSGVPLTVVRDWLGHRLVATTERYVGRYRSDAGWSPPVPVGLRAQSVSNPRSIGGQPGPSAPIVPAEAPGEAKAEARANRTLRAAHPRRRHRF